VLLIEKGKIGAKTSSVAAGLLAPSGQIYENSPFAEIATASTRLFPTLAEELHETSGIDIDYDPCGSIRLAFDETEASKLKACFPVQRELGYQVEWLSEAQVRKFEPAAAPDCVGAVYCAKEAQVSPQKLAAAFAEGARRYGAEVIHGRMIHTATNGKYVYIAGTPRKQIEAKYIVIATGVWSPPEGQHLGICIPVEPIKGQIATVQHLTPRPTHIIFGGDIYIAPKPDNTITVGATKEKAGYNDQPTISGMLDLFSQAICVVPNLGAARMGHFRAGLRPRTPDKLPIIGPVPETLNILFAVGHNSNGILMSAITGQMITAYITGNDSPIDLKPFSIERFGAKN
jgi:glycine oxidase